MPMSHLVRLCQAGVAAKKGPQMPAPSPTPPSPLRTALLEADRNRRKSHYPWTKDGGQVKIRRLCIEFTKERLSCDVGVHP
jgi:hypothetical protein